MTSEAKKSTKDRNNLEMKPIHCRKEEAVLGRPVGWLVEKKRTAHL